MKNWGKNVQNDLSESPALTIMMKYNLITASITQQSQVESQNKSGIVPVRAEGKFLSSSRPSRTLNLRCDENDKRSFPTQRIGSIIPSRAAVDHKKMAQSQSLLVSGKPV